MRICRVKIDNYRNIKHVDVELSNIVTLIGENNSGKSNFLRAISLPLSSEDGGFSRRLSWYDINNDAKKLYYDFLKSNRQRFIDGKINIDEFITQVPHVAVQLYFQPEEREHYNVKDILVDENNWIGSILYQFYVKKPEELFNRIKAILSKESDSDAIQMSLLPMELFDYSITVPGKGNNVAYDTLRYFCAVDLPAERDYFASSVGKLGSRALTDILQQKMEPEAKVKIEKAYVDFFETVKEEGNLEEVFNWQDYSDIENAIDFFEQISVLPNIPQMSSILGSIRLGYDNDYMFTQGLGHRNLVLMTVILNSYYSKHRDISFRLMTVEEPEAHLCVSNVLLMASLFNFFSHKNSFTQIVYSTHNTELVNKMGLDKVLVMHNGNAFSLDKELSKQERDYLTKDPNTDIFKVLYSRKAILIEGITEELLIKSYLQTRSDLNDIKVLSFHKGFTKIIDIWEKVNKGTGNKLGIVRDYDDQPNARNTHEKKQSKQVMVRTTKDYTLETDLTNANYVLLKKQYGETFGWKDMTAEEIQKDWRKDSMKTRVMLRICQDLLAGELDGLCLPPHIQEIIDFMQGVKNEG